MMSVPFMGDKRGISLCLKKCIMFIIFMKIFSDLVFYISKSRAADKARKSVITSDVQSEKFHNRLSEIIGQA